MIDAPGQIAAASLLLLHAGVGGYAMWHLWRTRAGRGAADDSAQTQRA